MGEKSKDLVKVSVVIPCFNPSVLEIKRSIDSVLSQTAEQLELIVVDDGSMVPFGGVEESYIQEEVRWVCLLNNIGVGAARNFGARIASGKLLVFLDTGDWWEVDKIKMHLLEYQQNEYSWSFSSAIFHYDSGDSVIEKAQKICKDHKSLSLIYSQNVVSGSASSVIIDNNFFHCVGGFDEDRLVIEDWDLWIRLFEEACPITLELPLVNILVASSGSRSKDVAGKVKRLEGMFSKHAKRIEELGLTRFWAKKVALVHGHILVMGGKPLKAIWVWTSGCRGRILEIPWIRVIVALFSVAVPSAYQRAMIARRRMRN
jgi:glycosyltransferase involved in cell wall biosynthesis